MRIWSVHPKYLDAKGLVAVWREGLLARAVLQGRTRGYMGHPQLLRFRAAANPVAAITQYLWVIYDESLVRGYRFDHRKLARVAPCAPLTVTTGQLAYEFQHLKQKLILRNQEWYDRFKDVELPDPHPLFASIDGDVEPWERIH